MARKSKNTVTVSYGKGKDEKLAVSFTLSEAPEMWKIDRLREIARTGWLYKVKQALATYVKENFPAYQTTLENIEQVKASFNPSPEMLEAYITKLDLAFDPNEPFPASFEIDVENWEALPADLSDAEDEGEAEGEEEEEEEEENGE
jgi:hypothetical protein